jgi:putative ABC transport system permease protein
MSLALSTLLYEWRRYLAAVIALALAGVLMLALGALLVGILQSFTTTIDRSRAQLIVMTPKATSLVSSGVLPKRVVPLVYKHPEVVEVQDLPNDFGQFFAEGATSPDFVNVMVIDPSANAVTLPSDFTEEMRKKLEPPFAVAVDKSALNQLGVKLGDRATLNGRTVTIALILEGYANAQQPAVVLSRQTLRLMGRANDDQLGLLMVRIKDPARATQVRDELNALGKDQFQVWLKDDLSEATIRDAMSEGFIVVLLTFMSVIGSIIGIVITWQTLRGAILANIKEFASLRALGVSIPSLRSVVMELSLWVGIVGVIMSAIIMFGITALAATFNLPMGYQAGTLIQTAIILLLISIGSGALTLGALKKGDPADLLK